MKLNLARVTLGMLCFSMLHGCGGSGGGGGPAIGPPDSRGVLLAAIETKLETFTGANMESENQQMLAFLQSKPEFVQTGLTSDGAWDSLLTVRG